MRRGAWHQFGDRSQKLALEQLENGIGVGVILSPRDLALNKATEYAERYHSVNAEVLIDQQFHVPDFTNSKIKSYPTDSFRKSVSQLQKIGDDDLAGLVAALRSIHVDLSATGVVAPAIVHEAGRLDVVQTNRRLFAAAQTVGDELGIPTYASVVLGRSASATDQTLMTALSDATALNADGWYYGFEFGDDRLPVSRDSVFRCMKAGLILACTGKPVLHGYAGPIGILSLGFGSTGVGIGHSQNLWGFDRSRWQEQPPAGGGGDAPPRFFSSAIWGTIIYPDELALLPAALQNQVITSSPFSEPVTARTRLPWERWDANKHLVHVICSTIERIASASRNAREAAEAAMSILRKAVDLHSQIAATGIRLKDGTNSYQANWLAALADLVDRHAADYAYLDLL